MKLVSDIISMEDINALIEWLKTNPRLTKGELTRDFEEDWSKRLGRKYSVYVNSGSSANLAMVYALMMSERMKNKKVVVPALCWSTTIAPLMQFGLDPIMCDVDKRTLCVDTKHLRDLFRSEKPAALIMVNVLGFLPKIDAVRDLCEEFDVILLEDSCETLGTTYCGEKAGTFGLMSTFSLYFGHHLSTIEGGMISTDDEEIYDLLMMIRSHGWDRDLDGEKQSKLRKIRGIDEFNSMYTFYVPGFNIRATDLQAFIGLRQLRYNLGYVVDERNYNFNLYQSLIKNDYWKASPKFTSYDIISNFAYPIIHPKRDELVKAFTNIGVECRPLICGSIVNQPFFKDRYVRSDFEFSSVVHKYGMYIPNHPGLTEEEIEDVCEVINEVIK